MVERSAAYTPINEPLPAYSSTWGNDFISDGDQKRSAGARQGRVGWLLAIDSAKNRTKTIARKVSPFTRGTISFLKKIRITKTQSIAFGLVVIFVALPFFLVGSLFGYSYMGYNGDSLGDPWAPFAVMFSTKVISCGDGLFNEPQNATVAGIEALFTLDFTFGTFPFSQVKLIDIAWDLVIGRGAQLCAWYISYVVFSNALLRVIERHPTSFRTFARICLEGPCLASMRALCRDLFRTRSKRTVSLFVCMLLSTAYVLSLPTLLGAMTGYVNTSIAWVSLDNNSDQIVPADSFRSGLIVTNVINGTEIIPMNSTCTASDQISKVASLQDEREEECKCQASNGTLVYYNDLIREWYSNKSHISYDHTREEISHIPYDHNREGIPLKCAYNYTDNVQTYMSSYGEDGKYLGYLETSRITRNCNATEKVTLFGKEYLYRQVNWTSGYCHNDQGYDIDFLQGRSRCLPDTANPAFQWGFSSMLSAVFLIVHFIWGVTMYSIWQDAQFNSKLVKSGFKMTPLRAAFSLAAAAESRTGLNTPELVRADSKSVEAELMGGKRKRLAVVGYDIFRDGRISSETMRRRKTLDA